MSASLVTVETHDDITILTLSPRCANLSESLIQPVNEAFLEASAAAQPKVLVDLEHVSFFSSSFIEILFRLWKHIKEKPGGRFALASVSPDCLEILQVTNLTTVWDVFDDRDAALAALAES
ncbi:MAG: STAS domain-containing protein [Planctomycetaceae bacterium]|nr:STAS domain-containing protein [Planctomycetaceae bacterium]